MVESSLKIIAAPICALLRLRNATDAVSWYVM